MPIERPALAALAATFTGGMTSIRGRRVQRLVMREFAAFDYVVPAGTRAGKGGLVGVADGRAAWCATDGRGKDVTVVSWSFPPLSVTTTRFDLLKDSLPALEAITGAPAGAEISIAADALPAPGRTWAARALAALLEGGRR